MKEAIPKHDALKSQPGATHGVVLFVVHNGSLN
jgi:hypothetical protein